MRASCSTCTRRKTRCDGEQPCGTCERLGVDCVRTKKQRPGPKPRAPPAEGVFLDIFHERAACAMPVGALAPQAHAARLLACACGALANGDGAAAGAFGRDGAELARQGMDAVGSPDAVQALALLAQWHFMMGSIVRGAMAARTAFSLLQMSGLQSALPGAFVVLRELDAHLSPAGAAPWDAEAAAAAPPEAHAMAAFMSVVNACVTATPTPAGGGAGLRLAAQDAERCAALLARIEGAMARVGEPGPASPLRLWDAAFRAVLLFALGRRDEALRLSAVAVNFAVSQEHVWLLVVSKVAIRALRGCWGSSAPQLEQKLMARLRMTMPRLRGVLLRARAGVGAGAGAKAGARGGAGAGAGGGHDGHGGIGAMDEASVAALEGTDKLSDAPHVVPPPNELSDVPAAGLGGIPPDATLTGLPDEVSAADLVELFAMLDELDGAAGSG